jgi:hypothetical protein
MRGGREWWEGVGGWAASSWIVVMRWQSRVTHYDDHSSREGGHGVVDCVTTFNIHHVMC